MQVVWGVTCGKDDPDRKTFLRRCTAAIPVRFCHRRGTRFYCLAALSAFGGELLTNSDLYPLLYSHLLDTERSCLQSADTSFFRLFQNNSMLTIWELRLIQKWTKEQLFGQFVQELTTLWWVRALMTFSRMLLQSSLGSTLRPEMWARQESHFCADPLRSAAPCSSAPVGQEIHFPLS